MRFIMLCLLFINPGYSHYYRNYSDQANCRIPLGMASGAIKNEQITASSVYNEEFSKFGAHRARLNLTRGYRADRKQSGGWIKVELEKQMVITGIATQGYGDPRVPEWTEQYMVMYSNGGDYLYFQNLEGDLKTFTGNKDSNSIRRNEFPLPQIATSIMLMESGVHENFAIRMELYGCEPGYYFVVWLLLGDFTFSTTYLDKQEVEYQATSDGVVDEVVLALKRTPGFLSASLLQFSPQASGAEIKLKAELKIECIEANVHGITAALTSFMQMDLGLFDTHYTKLQYPLDYKCRPPDVHIHLNKTHRKAARITAVDMFVIIGEVTAHCNSSSSLLLLSWERSKVNKETGAFAVGPSLDKFRGSKNLTIEPRTLSPGLYYFRLVAEMTEEEGAINSDFGFLEVVLPDIVAKIRGENMAVKGTGKIILDASDSYDPYEKNLKDQGLVFTWLCRREEEDFSNVQLLPIDQSNGRDKVLGGCFGYGVGALNTTEPTIEIDISGMISQSSYVFKVIVQKDNRSSSANHSLLIASSISFAIRCKTNCGDRVTANKRMVIESTCTGLSCKTIKSYNWTLYMVDPWSVNETWIEEKLGDKILTELDSPILVFKGKLNQWENSLMDDGTYRLRGIVHLTDGTTEESEISFRTNSAPYPIHNYSGCKVNPKKGHAVTTEFFISCDGWYDDDLPLSYEFSYHTNTGFVVVQKGSSPNATARLPLGDPLHDYAIALEIQILDSLGASTLEILVAMVEAMPSEDVSGTLMNMASGEESPLGNLLKSGDVDKAATMAYAVLSMVDTSEGKMDSDQKKSATLVRTVLRSQFNVTKNTVRDLKDTIIGQMSHVKVTSLEQVTQMAAVVALATEQKDEISTQSQENAVNLLENTADFVSSQLSSGTADPEALQNVGFSLLYGISNVMSAASTGAKQEEVDENEGDESVVTEESIKETNKEKKKDNKEKSKKTAEKTLELMDKVGSSLLGTKTVGEKPSVFKSKSLKMMLDRQVPSKIGGKKLDDGEGESGVALPSAATLFGDSAESLPSVDSQMLSFTDNPYTWDASSNNIKSSVIDFSLKAADGSALEVSGLPEPVELFIPQKKDNEKKGNETATVYFAKPSDGSNNLRFHQVVVPLESSSMIVEVKPEDGVSLEIYVRPKNKPTVTEYSFSVILPKIEFCNSTDTTLNCSSEAYKFSISSALTDHVGLHYVGIRYPRPESDPTSSSKVEVEMVAERVRRGCESHGGRQKRSCIGVKTPPTTPPPKLQILVPKYNASTDVNYTMSVTATSCLYWSETKQTWTGDGCKVGPKTVARNLHCLCTHLSAFGGDFFVAPNPIDFDKVWAEFGNLAESGNFVVLATVCSLFGLYFVGLVFARKSDKKDELKVVANVYLTDNTDDGYLYEISVQTGMWKGYGTTANIGLIIYGELDTTPPLPLSDPGMDKIFFARGSINNFTLSVPESLGNLVKIKIWHDNSGRSPAWFFQQVQIVDTQTGEKWNFLGNRWLAVEKGSGQIELEVKAADKKELAGFRNLFYSRTARSLGDGHLWLSVFTRPPHNTFTRCQRLTCCLSILFATLVTNAMFYQFDKAPGDTFQVGPLKLSWIQIKIGIQSSIIAIPVNVLVVTIFKNIKHPPPVDARGSNKKVPGCLPHFFVYVGWTLCLLTSLAAGAFTVFYSLMWGAETSNKWLTSIMISFFQDVIVTQPIKVVLIASLLSLIIKKPPEQEEVIGSSMSRSSGKDSQVSAPHGEALRKAREFQSKVLEMFRTIIEMVFFFLFIALLMVVCYGNRKPTRFMLTTELEKRFSGFDKVHNPDTFWTWTRAILVPGLYNVAWYNGKPFEYEEGFISSREAFMVGMPRLRQARIKPDVRCAVELNQPELAHRFGRCLSAYVDKVADSTFFNQPGWFPVENTSVALSMFELYEMCPRPWRYRTAENLTTLSVQGLQSSYGGGGFVADLGYNAKSALEVLDSLQKNNWINDLTAAVFVEFTIHEPATALFSVVKYLFERLPTGGYNTETSIKTLTLYASPDSAFGSFYQLCQLLLMLIILFFFFAEIGKIYRQKCGYFKLFWNWMELLQIFGAVAAIVMFFFKEMYTSRYVKRVQNNPFETSSTDYIVLWSELEIYLLAFVIFIVTMKFLRLIRFNRHICQMIATIQRSVGHLFSFFVVFVAIILAYTQLGLLVFGSNVPAYSSFFQAMRAVCQMILGGESHFHELKATSRFVGPLFVFCYMLSMSMIMLNMFLAILNDSYEEVKDVEGDSFADAELGEFMKTYFETRVGHFCDEFTAYFKKMMSFAQAKRRPKIQDVESYVKVPTDSIDGLDKVDGIEVGDEIVKLAKIVSMEDLSDSEDDISEALDDVKHNLSDINEEIRRSISLLGSDTNLKTFNKDLKCSCEDNSYPYFGNIWERQYDPNDRFRRRKTPYTEPLLAEISMDHLEDPHLKGDDGYNNNDRNGYPYFTNIWDRLIDPNDRFHRRRRLRTPQRESLFDDHLQEQTEEVDLGVGEEGDRFDSVRLEEHSTPEVMSNSTTNSNLLDDIQESFV